MKPTLHTLQNGLKVVLEENHAAPVVSLNALVRVGSADETNPEAGICHVIEHMLFKGTERRKVGEIARDVEAAGGEVNAYTSFDQTVYYINMAKRFVDKGLDILADAIQNPTFDATELTREQEVILEEIRRERDNPGRWIGEILFQKAYPKHPYGRPIIGFDKTVKSFTQDHLFRFYHRWYVPQNVFFIVVGDFKSAELLKKIEAAFAGFKRDHPFLEAPRIAELPQRQATVTIQSDPIQSTYFAFGFHIPEIIHTDIPAIDILSHILGGTTSSRLEQTLRERRRLVQSIYTHAYTPKDPGLLLVGGQLNATQAPKAFEIFWDEIEKINQAGPTLEEVKRAKLNIRSHEVYEKETVGGQAGKLGYFLATTGDLGFEEKYYQQLQNVTEEEIRQAAQHYLKTKNFSAALLIPKADDQLRWRGNVERALTQTLSRKKIAPAPCATTTPKKIRLSNGVRVILKADHSLPIVAIDVSFLGGLLAETKANNGVGHLMAQCITKGTKQHNALEIAEAVERIAGHLESSSGKNSFGVRLETLSDYLEPGLNLLSEILLSPRFDPKEVEKEKKLTLEAIKNQEDQLASLAFYHFQKTLFPHHPYGMRELGSKESVPKLKPHHLQKWQQKLFCASNMVISVVGDFSEAELTALLEKTFAALPRRQTSFAKPKHDPKPSQRKKVVTYKPKEQAHIVLGFSGPSFLDDDYYAMVVLNTILSGMGGRLFVELRDKLSLAYAITSVFSPGLDPGTFAVYIGTEPSKVSTAIAEIEKELKKIITAPVTEAELEKTKNHLVGTYELELQRNSNLAQLFALDELYGQGFQEVLRYPEKILRISKEDVLHVAKKYIDLNASVLSIIQPAKS